MSTKTSFKRIALVAASALAIAGFSAVPAHAGYTTQTTVAGTSTVTTANVTVAAGSGTVSVYLNTTIDTIATDAIDAIVTVVSPAAAAAAGAAPSVTCVAGALTGSVAKTASTTAGGIRFTDAGTTHLTGGVANLMGTCSFPTATVGTYKIIVTPTVATGITISAETHVATTIYAGYSANSTYANTAFPTQGSNVTTGWAGTAGGQASVKFTNFAASKTYYITTDTGSIISTTEYDTNGYLGAVANTSGLTTAGGVNFTTAAGVLAHDGLVVTVTDLGAATTTVTIKSFDASTGVASTFSSATVTWGVSAVPSAQYSILDLNATTGVTIEGTDETVTTVANTTLTKFFTIQAVVKDQYNVAYNGATLAASISGPGSIGIATTTDSTAALSGRSLSVALTGTNLGHITVWGDGTSGAATITITATTSAGVTYVLGTKTVTFTGSPKTATVTQVLSVAKAGTVLGGATLGTNAATNDGSTYALSVAFKAKVVDALGNAVASGRTYKLTSSDSTVITVGTCTEYTTAGATSYAPGNWECSVSGAAAAVSGKSATVTFSILNTTTGLYDIVAAPLTFSIGGSIATTAVTLDKASYVAGEAMALTATAKDSTGFAAYDGQDPYYTDASANKTVSGLDTTGSFIVGGVSTLDTTVFAPATTGDFIISGKGVNTAGTGSAFAITANVEKDADASLALDAANAATDAANNAYDEAQNATQAASDALAAVTALAAQVKSLIASVKKLTAAVAKLKK